jgi:hypothetical protein
MTLGQVARVAKGNVRVVDQRRAPHERVHHERPGDAHEQEKRQAIAQLNPSLDAGVRLLVRQSLQGSRERTTSGRAGA